MIHWYYKSGKFYVVDNNLIDYSIIKSGINNHDSNVTHQVSHEISHQVFSFVGQFKDAETILKKSPDYEKNPSYYKCVISQLVMSHQYKKAHETLIECLRILDDVTISDFLADLSCLRINIIPFVKELIDVNYMCKRVIKYVESAKSPEYEKFMNAYKHKKYSDAIIIGNELLKTDNSERVLICYYMILCSVELDDVYGAFDIFSKLINIRKQHMELMISMKIRSYELIVPIYSRMIKNSLNSKIKLETIEKALMNAIEVTNSFNNVEPLKVLGIYEGYMIKKNKFILSIEKQLAILNLAMKRSPRLSDTLKLECPDFCRKIESSYDMITGKILKLKKMKSTKLFLEEIGIIVCIPEIETKIVKTVTNEIPLDIKTKLSDLTHELSEMKISHTREIEKLATSHLLETRALKLENKSLVSDYEAKKSKWKSQYESLRIENVSMKNELSELKLKLLNTPENVSYNIKHGIDQLKKQLEIKKDENSKMKNMCCQYVIQIEKLKSELLPSKDEITHLKKLIGERWNDVESYRRKNESLASHIKDITSSFNELNDKYVIMRNNFSELNSRVSQIANSDVSEFAYYEIIDENDKLKCKISEMKNVVNDSRNTVDDLNNTVDKLKNEIVSKSNVIGMLKQMLKK